MGVIGIFRRIAVCKSTGKTRRDALDDRCEFPFGIKVVRDDLPASWGGQFDHQFFADQTIDESFEFVKIIDRLHARSACAEFTERLLAPQEQFGHDGGFDFFQSHPMVGIMPNLGHPPASLDHRCGP